MPTERGSYQSYGTLSKLDDTTLHISELPLRKWTQDYKETVLEPLSPLTLGLTLTLTLTRCSSRC